MITDLTIEGFRGIRMGNVAGIRALTVLTGPNGCGKSSVLDALLLAESNQPAHALERVLRRHPHVALAADWLGFRRSESVTFRAATTTRLVMNKTAVWTAEEMSTLPEPRRTILCHRPADQTEKLSLVVGADGRVVASRPVTIGGRRTVLVDSGIAEPLGVSWTAAVRSGARPTVESALHVIVPNARGLTLLQEEDGSNGLYVEFDGYAVPVALGGDGVQAAVQILLQLAPLSSGELALVEEPEVYQHPRTLHHTASVLAATAKRGVQVVLTTHSIELVDALAAAIGDLEQMSVIRMDLRGGELVTSVFVGDAIAIARADGFQDLR